MILSKRHNILIALFLIFIISNIYLYWFGSYLFFYQESNTLFLFSSQYLHQFVIKPGGLLEYAGNFLAQGYFSPAYGSLILSVILTSLIYVVSQIHKRLDSGRSESLFLIAVPSSLLLLMQLNFNWFMWSNLGILFTFLYFLLSIASDKKRMRIFWLVLFPVFYYFAGAFAWIYLGLYIVYSLLYDKGPLRYYYPALLMIISCLSFFVFKEIIFLQSVDALLLSPFSIRNQFMHPWTLYLLIGFIVLFPLLVKVLSFIKIRTKYAQAISISSILLVFIVSTFLLSKLYNPKIANLFQLEKCVSEQNWEDLIEHQETYQLSNIVAQYYYNLALSEKGLLCDRLFFAPQDFGPRALIIPWNPKAGPNNIARGIYFYYSVGLINEAHRWAYESMVTQGYRPENLKILIKTNLINGHYSITEKYIQILERTLHYKKWAQKYKAMLYRPDLIEADPELGEKIKILPKEDFTITFDNPINNIYSLLQSNLNNKRAFEYIIAWNLLAKNVDAVIAEVDKMKEISYTKIPRHIEEVLLLYNRYTGLMPDIGELTINNESIELFKQYEFFSNPFAGIPISDKKDIQEPFLHTYWLYLDYKK